VINDGGTPPAASLPEFEWSAAGRDLLGLYCSHVRARLNAGALKLRGLGVDVVIKRADVTAIWVERKRSWDSPFRETVLVVRQRGLSAPRKLCTAPPSHIEYFRFLGWPVEDS
jgi:hypothetical protein